MGTSLSVSGTSVAHSSLCVTKYLQEMPTLALHVSRVALGVDQREPVTHTLTVDAGDESSAATLLVSHSHKGCASRDLGRWRSVEVLHPI